MEIFRINIKAQTEIERHESFKKSLHNCPICTTSLEFELEPGPQAMLLLEKARCPACQIEIRSELHTEQ